MGRIVGQLIGGIVAIFIIATVLEFLLIRHLIKYRPTSKGVSAVLATLAAAILGGFGFAGPNERFSLTSAVYYLLLGLLIVVWAVDRGFKEQIEQRDREYEAADTFE